MKNVIKSILAQCKKNKKMNIKSTSHPALVVINDLEKLRNYLEQKLNIDPSEFEYKISRGSGFFPKNPWIAIVKKGTKVSNALSVCICFSKNGNGFVMGLMYFTVAKNRNFQTIIRDTKNTNFVDINGTNFRTTRNNNKFVNPIEIFEQNIDLNHIVTHLKESFRLLKKHSANLI